MFDAFSLWQGTASSLYALVSPPVFDPRKPLSNNKSTSAVALSRTGFSYSSGILHLCPIFMPDLSWHISCSWQEVCKTSLALLGRGECCSSAETLSSTSAFCPCCICQPSMLNFTVHVHLISEVSEGTCAIRLTTAPSNSCSPQPAGCFPLYPFSMLIYLPPQFVRGVSRQRNQLKNYGECGERGGRWIVCSSEADFFRKWG